jgi:hypothetical protein
MFKFQCGHSVEMQWVRGISSSDRILTQARKEEAIIKGLGLGEDGLRNTKENISNLCNGSDAPGAKV